MMQPGPIRAYRLIKEKYLSAPLSVEGARLFGGRWNPPGVGILYTSASPELALLEQLVHLRSLPLIDLPQLMLITLQLPELPRLFLVSDLPINWRDEVDHKPNHQFLSTWLNQPEVLAVGMPSAVVRESYNYLLHAQHPAYSGIKVIDSAPFSLDTRLWQRE